MTTTTPGGRLDSTDDLLEANAAVRTAVMASKNCGIPEYCSDDSYAADEEHPVLADPEDESDNTADPIHEFRGGWTAEEVMERFARPENPAIATLKAAIDAVNDRHTKYGPPGEHFARTVALINACFGTSFVAKDWATMMQLDKIARSQGPHDDPDNDVDCIGYAACRSEVR